MGTSIQEKLDAGLPVSLDDFMDALANNAEAAALLEETGTFGKMILPEQAVAWWNSTLIVHGEENPQTARDYIRSSNRHFWAGVSLLELRHNEEDISPHFDTSPHRSHSHYLLSI